MTISSVINRKQYSGNGVTLAFAFPYYFLLEADLKVYVDSTLKTLTTDYTVTGEGDPSGGTVTFLVAPANGTQVMILRDPALTQTTDYTENDSFPAETHEEALDKLTMLEQRTRDLLSRAAVLPDSVSTEVDPTLPIPVALEVIAWDSDGTGLTTYDATDLATVVATGNPRYQLFDGDNSETDFTLDAAPVALGNLKVYISGVRQTPGVDYTLSSTTLTFTTAPPTGTDNILAEWVNASTSLTEVSDGSVTSAKIADLQVTTPKLADGAVTSAKLSGTLVNGFTTVAAALGDSAGIADASDSGNNKKTAISSILALLFGYFYGFAPSTAGSSATLTVGTGACADSTNADILALTSAISKTTSAWAVGTAQGGLDTGVIANNTTYHWYAIKRPDTGVVDVIFSLSATSPTLPANYTEYRYLFPWRTNGSAQWVLMVYSACDDSFLLDTAVLDVNTNNPGTSSVTATLASIPTGIKVKALVNAQGTDSSGGIQIYVRSLDQSDQAPSATVAPLSTSISVSASTSGSVSNVGVRTNTSAQIGYRIQSSAGTTNVRIATLGFIYRMGSR